MARRDCALTAVLLTLLSGWAVHAQVLKYEPPKPLDREQLPWADRLDESTTAYVYRMSWSDLAPRLAGTVAGRVLDDPPVQAFFAELERIGRRGGPADPFYRFVWAALKEETICAAREPSLDEADAAAARGRAGANAVPPANDVMITRVRADRRTELAGLLNTAIESWPGDILPRTQIDGREFSVLGGAAGGLYLGWQDDALLWAVSPAAARWILQPPPERPLGQAAMFRDTVQPLLAGATGPPIAVYYYDLRKTWERLEETPASAIWQRLSWRSMDACAGATFIEGEGFHNRHYWRIGARRVGLFEYTQTVRVNAEWLKRVPADASGFTTGVFDAYSALVSFALLAGTPFGLGNQEVASLGTMLIPLQPMLSNVGPRYLVYRVPGRYGNFPFINMLPLNDLVMVAELRDPEAFSQALQGLLTQPNVPTSWQTVRFGTHDVRVLSLMYLSVYFAICERDLIVTIHPQFMKDALDQWDRPGPALVDTPAFRAAAPRILPNACFLMYFPPGGFARGIYDQYIPQLQQLGPAFEAVEHMGSSFRGGPRAGRTEPGLNLLLLPRGSDMAKHVTQPTILSAADDGTGILFDGYAPLLCTPYYWTFVHAWQHLTPAVEPDDRFAPFVYLFKPVNVPK